MFCKFSRQAKTSSVQMNVGKIDKTWDNSRLFSTKLISWVVMTSIMLWKIKNYLKFCQFCVRWLERLTFWHVSKTCKTFHCALQPDAKLTFAAAFFALPFCNTLGFPLCRCGRLPCGQSPLSICRQRSCTDCGTICPICRQFSLGKSLPPLVRGVDCLPLAQSAETMKKKS